jgi:CheY-like chemotaxis protein
MQPTSVLVVGSQNETGRQAIIPAGLSAPVDVRHVADLGAAEALLGQPDLAAELLVLVQSRPGQWSATAIDALRRASPLAQVCRVLGSWCEGEARSGQPPQGCLSIYWHQWQARFAQQLDRRMAGCEPAWSLPPTASAEEHALAEAERPLARGEGPIAVYAERAESAGALADACRSAGYEIQLVCSSPRRPACIATAPRDTKRVRAVVWDTSPEEMTEPRALSVFRDRFGWAPVLAVVDFPRADDFARAIEAGVEAVISKPYSIHDLLWHLDRAIGGRTQGVSA